MVDSASPIGSVMAMLISFSVLSVEVARFGIFGGVEPASAIAISWPGEARLWSDIFEPPGRSTRRHGAIVRSFGGSREERCEGGPAQSRVGEFLQWPGPPHDGLNAVRASGV